MFFWRRRQSVGYVIGNFIIALEFPRVTEDRFHPIASLWSRQPSILRTTCITIRLISG
jgi:hypothetical protein